MELRHLRHFLAVAYELHMGRAAERLGMAQPPLSQSSARLERDLGVRLFERGRRRLALTRAGEAFLDEARSAVAHAESARRLATAADSGSAGVLRLGFVSAALYEWLPRLMAQLRDTYPDVRPQLVELSTNEQLDALAKGAIDIGFVHPPLGADSAFTLLEFPAEPLLAVLPDDGKQGDVGLADIAALGLVLFPAAQGPVLHARIMDAFARAQLQVRVVQEATRALTMLALVSAGLGAALLPASIQRIAYRGVRYARLAGADLPALPLAMVARRKAQPAVVRRAWALFAGQCADASSSLARGSGPRRRA